MEADNASIFIMTKASKERINRIIFETDTPGGKLFDVLLIVLIFLSIILVMLESVVSIQNEFGKILKILEWMVTIVFTIEYIVRIWIAHKPIKFIFSFFGIVDFLSFLPTYIAIFLSGTHGLMVIRALRLLRVFRVLKLNRYVEEGNSLIMALKASRYKIGMFLYAVLMIIIVIGAVMYLVEGEMSGFDSIPRSMYWVIVTITTVGFGDIVPQTTLGQFIASFIMILGYAIIAVPTGIVTAEISMAKKALQSDSTCCKNCDFDDHDKDANFCKKCGSQL